MKYLFYFAGAASLLAIGQMPSDFYEVLRWLLSAAAIGLGLRAYKSNEYSWFVLAVPVFAIWFPPFGVYMERSSWLLLNLAAGIGFIVAGNSRKLTQGVSEHEHK